MKPMESPHVSEAASACRILLANGDKRRKAALGVSNQEFGSKLTEANGTIAVLAAQLAIAEDVLKNGTALYRPGLLQQYQHRVLEFLEKGASADV